MQACATSDSVQHLGTVLCTRVSGPLQNGVCNGIHRSDLTFLHVCRIHSLVNIPARGNHCSSRSERNLTRASTELGAWRDAPGTRRRALAGKRIGVFPFPTSLSILPLTLASIPHPPLLSLTDFFLLRIDCPNPLCISAIQLSLYPAVHRVHLGLNARFLPTDTKSVAQSPVMRLFSTMF